MPLSSSSSSSSSPSPHRRQKKSDPPGSSFVSDTITPHDRLARRVARSHFPSPRKWTFVGLEERLFLLLISHYYDQLVVSFCYKMSKSLKVWVPFGKELPGPSPGYWGSGSPARNFYSRGHHQMQFPPTKRGVASGTQASLHSSSPAVALACGYYRQDLLSSFTLRKQKRNPEKSPIAEKREFLSSHPGNEVIAKIEEPATRNLAPGEAVPTHYCQYVLTHALTWRHWDLVWILIQLLDEKLDHVGRSQLEEDEKRIELLRRRGLFSYERCAPGSILATSRPTDINQGISDIQSFIVLNVFWGKRGLPRPWVDWLANYHPDWINNCLQGRVTPGYFQLMTTYSSRGVQTLFPLCFSSLHLDLLINKAPFGISSFDMLFLVSKQGEIYFERKAIAKKDAEQEEEQQVVADAPPSISYGQHAEFYAKHPISIPPVVFYIRRALLGREFTTAKLWLTKAVSLRPGCLTLLGDDGCSVFHWAATMGSAALVDSMISLWRTASSRAPVVVATSKFSQHTTTTGEELRQANSSPEAPATSAYHARQALIEEYSSPRTGTLNLKWEEESTNYEENYKEYSPTNLLEHRTESGRTPLLLTVMGSHFVGGNRSSSSVRDQSRVDLGARCTSWSLLGGKDDDDGASEDSWEDENEAHHRRLAAEEEEARKLETKRTSAVIEALLRAGADIDCQVV